jgi:hypothetical protein
MSRALELWEQYAYVIFAGLVVLACLVGFWRWLGRNTEINDPSVYKIKRRDERKGVSDYGQFYGTRQQVEAICHALEGEDPHAEYYYTR